MTSTADTIQIHRARTHNLRNIDLSLPQGQLTVLTGVSGSGKSSLAFDTIFAEGRRRYVECLSPYVRRFLDQLERPDVDEIVGLPPTLSVSQWTRPVGGTPRSTVATMTEIHDYLRVLYARCGVFHCPRCGQALGTQTLQQILDATESLPDGQRIYILAPLVHGRKGKHADVFRMIVREGFLRARLDGAVTMVDGPREDLDSEKPHDIEMVVDRQVVRAGMRDRLADSFQTALKFGEGSLIVAYLDDESNWVDRLFSTRFACVACGTSYRELQPRNFSFNSPYGACPTCEGLGKILDFDPQRVIPDESRSLADGAIAPFRSKSGKIVAKLKKPLSRFLDDAQLKQPFETLAAETRHEIWNGNEGFPGVRKMLEELSGQTETEDDPVAEYRLELPCPDCRGVRLNLEARSVTVGELPIAAFLSLAIEEAAKRLPSWRFPEDKQPIAEPLVREIQSRLEFLNRVGVGYVELDRPVDSLSGGEAQRIRLTGCVGSGLNGVCYVLDEPTIGLHARDSDRLLQVLRELRDQGNTVLVVEHDESAIRAADWIVDLGPGAGADGGEIVNQGPLEDFLKGAGLTAAYLRCERRSAPPSQRSDLSPGKEIRLSGVCHHNLQNVDLTMPLGKLVCVTGVSGSGKSSLIVDVLVPALKQALRARLKKSVQDGSAGDPVRRLYRELEGSEAIAKVTQVDQGPIGRTPRSCPASFTGILDGVRHVFAKTKDAKVRGYTASRFSYNAKEGQCPDCQGLGALRLESTFLPEAYVPCGACRGKRYDRATLAVRFRGKTVADVLEMTASEAGEFFENHPKIAGACRILTGVGLGYLRLGQWATTLSGGEAQRLKLAAELANPSHEPTLFVLDEPTTGLHFHDVAHLVKVLRRLVDSGHSVAVIEHHLDLIAGADWVIDLGPEGGAAGGRIVAQGPPDAIMLHPDSVTGKALKATAI